MHKYIYSLFAAFLFALPSCMVEDGLLEPTVNPDQHGLQFIGAAEDFETHNVSTRAGSEVSDSFISEMTLLIFDNDGNMIPAYTNKGLTGETISSHIHIDKPNPTFLINATENSTFGILASMEVDITSKYYKNTADNLSACKIYIVANAYHLIGAKLENYEIKTLTQLEAALIDVDPSLAMPVNSDGTYIGLPMIGTSWDGSYNDDGTRKIATFNLSYNGGTSTSAVATIPLKKLYSKVYFRIQVNSNQIVAGGQTPKFKINNAEVYNVPNKVHMEYKSGDYVNNVSGSLDNIYMYRYISDTEKDPFVITTFNKNTISHSSSATTDDYIEFNFFMPEHMVTPWPIQYPGNIPVDDNGGLKQYYKPKGMGTGSEGGIPTTKVAPFVRINGTYTDHNAQIRDVSYDIYLGQNNYDNFEIKRNQQLNNYITITGLTNHKNAYGEDQQNISVDHRVTMSNKGFNLSMEREAILDAHFEVRPLDVELSPNSSMTIVIPEEEDQKWIAMELDAYEQTNPDKNLYVSTTEVRRGVRKYFTTNLVSELTNKATTITVKHSGKDNSKTEIHRIWFYIDENPNVYDKTYTSDTPEQNTDYTRSKNQYRLAKVKFFYNENADNAVDLDGAPSATINFQQWNLWRVWNSEGSRFYDIEHEEEYLNNYASDQGYGHTQDGMPWGLDGISLSNKQQSAYVDESGGIIATIIDIFGGFEQFVNNIITSSKISPYYDFYLTRDNPYSSITPRDYSGLEFNKEIAATLRTISDSKAKIDGITLTESPLSAFAYCYHKNKRNSEGVVENQNWFLPAIDEIEDIAMGAYDEFDKVFQGYEYWSCQPAFNRNTISIRIRGLFFTSTATGSYYDDDTDRARATKIVFNETTQKYQNISSDVDGNTMKLSGQNNGAYSSSITSSTTPTGEQINYHAGNNSRTGEKCRIRAVYRTGTK